MARAAKPKGDAPLLLICGDDEFGVKERARQVYKEWSDASGGMDQEVINATASNANEALKALAKLREALQTLPFFGGAKIVWFQDCNFLADDRTSSSKAVMEGLADLAKGFKSFNWDGVKLLITAGKVDKRKSFYKACESVGEVDLRAGWSLDDKDWAMQAESFAVGRLQALEKGIDDEAAALLVNYVGPNMRQLSNEVEKLAAYAGDRKQVNVADVEAIVSRNKQARAFALADALGDRQLPHLLKVLDEELWTLRTDKQKSAIGLLYGLISKVRVMLFLKEMLAAGWIKDDARPNDYGAYNRFKGQLDRVPVDGMPNDKKLNPLAVNPYMLFKALPHTRNFSRDELVRAMDLLLSANLKLVSSSLDEGVVLQQALVEIVGGRMKPAKR